jgi:hypothetical protein
MRHSIFPALAATEAEALPEIYSRTECRKVIEVIKATTEGLDYTWTQRGTNEIIARWMNLNPAQTTKAYDPGRGCPFEGRHSHRRAGKALHRHAGNHGGIQERHITRGHLDFCFANEAAKK